MKRLLLGFSFMIMLLTACAPRTAATQEPVVVEQPTQISTDLTPAQRIAISKVTENLGVTPDKVKLISTEAVEWPDSCLGVSTPGIMCSQVVTPGFRVKLEVNGQQVEYHTNQDASVIVPATVALTWSRSGGLAGFCDNMTIYLSGEVQATSCKKNDIVDKKLTDLVSSQEIATMNEWISKYSNVTIDMSDPKGAADAMTIKLQLFGTGTQQLTSQSTQQILLQFVQNLNQKLMSQ